MRLIRSSSAFSPGNRLVRILPGIPTALAVGDNNIRIEDIAVRADGSISQAQGQIKPQKGTIEPVVRSLRFEAGDYVGAWRLRRYEKAFAPGSRSIAIFAADRQLTINFGNFETETPAFDPNAATGAVMNDGSLLRFNLVSVPVDPGDLAATLRVEPFETTFRTGRRIVQMPRMAAGGNVSLISGADSAGGFRINSDGSIFSQSPGLTVSGSSLTVSTLPVRIETGGSSRPYRVMPFEPTASPGDRTVTMVRGQSCRIESNGETLVFQIDTNVSLSTRDSHLSTFGNTVRVTWP